MKKDRYASIDEFKSQYTGEWDPSVGHWLGLDFLYKEKEYRLQTGPMYSAEATILADGREAVYGLYNKQIAKSGCQYCLIEEFATIEDLLASTCIDGKKFEVVIVDNDTVLLGQD